MSNIVGFSSLRNNDRNDESEQEGRPNQYYVGGASDRGGGSGLSVIDPNAQNNDHVANIIARARQQAATSDDSVRGTTNHVITFYRDGFTVNDGPYRLRSDQANRPFLEAIERGVVPRELEGADRNEHVDINLVDKRHEDYTAPAAPRYTAFAGQGQTIGSSMSEGVVSTSTAASGARPVLDDSKPKTTLQIRLHNGMRLRETLNLHHTIQDIHTIIALNGAADQPYSLLAGFPPRPLPLTMHQTIQEAGLQGAAIIQKLA